MGLPGSGKTTFAKNLFEKLSKESRDVVWLNADKIRKQFNDWDFSYDGRIRQAQRMRNLAENDKDKWVIVDFVAPLKEMRNTFDADITIWMDTIEEGRFEDTNKVFEKPEEYQYRITDWTQNPTIIAKIIES